MIQMIIDEMNAKLNIIEHAFSKACHDFAANRDDEKYSRRVHINPKIKPSDTLGDLEKATQEYNVAVENVYIEAWKEYEAYFRANHQPTYLNDGEISWFVLYDDGLICVKDLINQIVLDYIDSEQLFIDASHDPMMN